MPQHCVFGPDVVLEARPWPQCLIFMALALHLALASKVQALRGATTTFGVILKLKQDNKSIIAIIIN